MKAEHLALLDVPPQRGMSLAWTVSLVSTLMLLLVMGPLTLYQHYIELNHERDLRRTLLGQSLVPLRSQIEASRDLQEVRRYIEAYHLAFVNSGLELHHLTLRNPSGQLLFTTKKVSDNRQYLKAQASIRANSIPGGAGVIIVEQSSNEEAIERLRWRDWYIHMIVTIAAVSICLAGAMKLLITKPLGRLLRDIGRMERGYGNGTILDSGARELRWLGWRFNCLLHEHQRTTEALVLAEKRAAESSSSLPDYEPKALRSEIHRPQPETDQSAGDEVDAKMVSLLRNLQFEPDNDPGIQTAAAEALDYCRINLDHHNSELRSRLECRALTLLRPDELASLRLQRQQVLERYYHSAAELANCLQSTLSSKGVPLLSLAFRIKNEVSVWRKMHKLDLSFEQITDLFGYRILVPTERDCYCVLGICHHLFKPILTRFKDYIDSPKPNGYQSLHTTVDTGKGFVVEIQIRSQAMHMQAELGSAAHVVYKADGKTACPPSGNFLQRFNRHWRHFLFRD